MICKYVLIYTFKFLVRNKYRLVQQISNIMVDILRLKTIFKEKKTNSTRFNNTKIVKHFCNNLSKFFNDYLTSIKQYCSRK